MQKDLKKQAKCEKKRAKAELKRLKKQQKYAKSAPKGEIERKTQLRKPRSSRLVNFAKSVRGILFLVTSVSIFIAIILADKGCIVGLEDLFGSFIAARAGKAVLAVVSVVFFVLGLKNLR